MAYRFNFHGYPLVFIWSTEKKCWKIRWRSQDNIDNSLAAVLDNSITEMCTVNPVVNGFDREVYTTYKKLTPLRKALNQIPILS